MSGENAAATIALSLISHTNAGKTTLARTLLGKDVGTVRDEQHVTEEASAYPLIETAEGDVLLLWDTPGFGDSARLARRLAQQGNPIGWFLSHVWDRLRDRAFFLSQRAVRNVRDDTDVVLYLVNASEAPADAGYLGAELDLLQWVGKPVIVLVNQTGPPHPSDEEQAEQTRWRNAVGARPIVRAVATLDAFTRCWVQEIALFQLVCDALPTDRRAACRRLIRAWQARRWKQFDEAMGVLAGTIAATACDREPVTEADAAGVLREIGRRLGIGRNDGDAAKTRAVKALAARLDTAVRAGTDSLIAIHGLEGRAAGEVLSRMANGVAIDAPLSEAKAAMMGGIASGAISGLAADLASGGLTFGAGMLAGALLGALGGVGIARGMNVARGKSGPVLRWDDAFLSAMVSAALLRYLAIAHHGRGRGDWVETEYPAFWSPLVMQLVESRGERLSALWASRSPTCNAERIGVELRVILAEAAREALERLYPGALEAFDRSALDGEPVTPS